MLYLKLVYNIDMDFYISKGEEGQRLDRYLVKKLPSLPTSALQKMIRKKDIKVNGLKTESGYILHNGDYLSVFLYPNRLTKAPKIHHSSISLAQDDIIYEDDNILVINKKKGFIIQGESTKTTYNLTDIIREHFKDDPAIGEVISPAHRLDVNTTGVMIYGKNVKTLQTLMELFSTERGILKQYLVLVFGQVTRSGVCESYLLKHHDNFVTAHSSPIEGAKFARLTYQPLECQDDMSLLRVELETGRTHQIRVQLAEIGHPVVGDAKYGDFSKNKQIGALNQLLHCANIKIASAKNHLSYLENFVFSAPLPNEFAKYRLKSEKK
jgi:23S rRNA pseudouridine955/2504/2580 synthase